MRKKQIFVLLVVFAFINVSIISLALYGTAKTNNGVRPLEEMALMDLTHENFVGSETIIHETTGGSSIAQPAEEGDEITVSVSDDYQGTVYDEDFTVVLEGSDSLILITTDAFDSFDGTNYYFLNEHGTWGFDEHPISHEQLEYMRDEFDGNIYPTVATNYGEPEPRGDEGQKVWILIFNIKDWAYYDEDAEWYIAGYFSSSISSVQDKNIIHIDTYYWADRIGPGVGRPYLYEGVIAHEFEHLVHYDIDSDEPSWVDEGLADLAGYFCGYGHSSGHIANYLVDALFTPLTFWGSSLADYGASYLFILYLYEKYRGVAFISDLVQEQANGIEGIQKTLDTWGHDITFDEIFDDWTIANYLDDPEGGLYGYDTLNIGTADTWGYSIEYALAEMYGLTPFGSKDWPLPFGLYASGFTGPPQPYTAHYYRFGGSEPLRAAIDGDETAGPGPHSGENAWYSDVGAWAWRSIYQTFDFTGYSEGDELTLNFSTYYEIEEDWDFGYVEVKNGADEWTTIADNEGYTINVDPFDQDNPNVPVGRDPQDYVAAGKWHAFTGNSDGWMPISMNLSSFAGDIIELHFRTWQDGAFTYQMMYVDDISITANGVEIFFDDAEDEGNWLTSPDYEGGSTWYIYGCYEENNWQATLIETLWQPTIRYPKGQNWHARKLLNEVHMIMNPGTQSGEINGIKETPVKSRRTQVLIVSNRADHILPADYWWEFTYAYT